MTLTQSDQISVRAGVGGVVGDSTSLLQAEVDQKSPGQIVLNHFIWIDVAGFVNQSLLT